MLRQFVRSATSIGANIVEAQAGSSSKDFINYYFHALKSANETKFWLALVRDTTTCDNKKLELLLKEVDELAKILGASIITLKKKK